MAAMCTPRRGGRKPLRPVTPMGQDLPEDTPSKIRARNAMECAGIRRRQEKEVVEANLETGREFHTKMVEEKELRATKAKTDAALRRDLLNRQMGHKRSTLQEEAERKTREKAREGEQQKATDALHELRRLELEVEEKEQREMTAETMSHLKAVKAAEETRERALVAQEYEAGLTDLRLKEEKDKALKKADAEGKKAAILEARELRAKERAVAAIALRAEAEKGRHLAKAKEEEKRAAAEEHRQLLRARANDYRTDKELAKTSAYAR